MSSDPYKTSPPPAPPKKRLTLFQWVVVCIVATSIFGVMFGLHILEDIATDYLRSFPTLGLAGVVLVVAVVVLMARRFRSRSDAHNRS